MVAVLRLAMRHSAGRDEIDRRVQARLASPMLGRRATIARTLVEDSDLLAAAAASTDPRLPHGPHHEQYDEGSRSKDGCAALWTGIVGPRYAPDVEIVGVASIAPAANMVHILAMSPAVYKRLGPYIALSYSSFYPDVTFEQALRPRRS